MGVNLSVCIKNNKGLVRNCDIPQVVCQKLVRSLLDGRMRSAQLVSSSQNIMLVSALSGIELATAPPAELWLVSIWKGVAGRTITSKASHVFAKRVRSKAKRAARSGYCTQNKSFEGITRFSVISLRHPLTCQFIMALMKNHKTIQYKSLPSLSMLSLT